MPSSPLNRVVARKGTELRRVQDVEHDDLMATVPEVFQPGDDPGGFVEEVGEDRDHAPLLEPLRQIVQDHADVRLLTGGVTSSMWSSSLSCDAWPAGFKYRRTASSNTTRPTESCCWRIM